MIAQTVWRDGSCDAHTHSLGGGAPPRSGVDCPEGSSLIYETFLRRSTERSRSMPTRYLLRNLCPTMPPSWNPRSALGALRFSTTTEKFLYAIVSNIRSTPGIRNASGSHPEVP